MKKNEVINAEMMLSVIKSFSIKKKVLRVIVFTFSLISSDLLIAADLDKVLFSKLPSDKVQINLVVKNGVFPEPKVFSTQDPARVVFDFYGLKADLKETDFAVGIGAVDTLKVVEVNDRTRLVMNLKKKSSYTVSQEGNQYIILVKNTPVELNTQKADPKQFARRPELSHGRTIEKIDFRRTNKAGGKIIVNLSDPQTTVNVGELDGEVVVDFKDVELGEGLEKRLDVTDFATTVGSIDTFQKGESVRMIISPTEEYQQISFQNDNILTVILDPVVESVKEEVEVDENGYSGERLSLNFQRLEIRSALSVISDFTGLNIIASDDVKGELTLNLKDVPWDQALDVILEAKGFAKRQKGNVIWVAPATRIAEFERQQLKAAQSSANLEPLVTEIIRINYARAEELKEVLESGQKDDRDSDVDDDGNSSRTGQVIVLRNSDGSSSRSSSSNRNGGRQEAVLKITSDERTNSLLVTTTSANMVIMKQLIRELDKPVRQVMVETRIVEATDTFSRELGAKLGFTRLTENARGLGSGSNVGNTAVSGSLGSANATQQSLINGGDVFSSASSPGGLNVDLGANGINNQSPASYAFSLFRAGTGFANIINLELSALEAEGRGKIVSSPRLVTSGQKAAVISTGTTRFVTIGVSDQGTPITETRDAFLGLSVNPQISPDDNVIMDVIINQDFFVSASEIRRNNIITQVTVENGETVIIGGIYQEQQVKNVEKVPLLGDLPILGNLFKKRSKRNDRTELLIFLTPKIINGELDLK